MGARGHGRSAPKPRGRLPQSLTDALSYLGLLSAVGAVLSLAFLLFIVLSGYLDYPVIGGSSLERMERNINLARAVFLWCLWIVVITGLVRQYQSDASGVAVILAGIACWGLLPLAVRSGISEQSADPLLALGLSLIESFQTTGSILIVVGLLRVVIGRVVLLASPPRIAGIPATGAAAAEIAARRAAQRPSPLRRCWELQFCRGSLRTNCPRFLEGVSCWKKRSGCYCDQNLATGLLSGVGAQARVELAEELETAQRRTQRLTRSRQSAKKEKRPRPPCGECPLYLEHQSHKYRVVSWLCYPAAAAVIGLAWVPIHSAYDFIYRKFGWLGVSIDRTGQGNVYYLPEWLSFENAMVVVIGIAVLGLILQVTEVLIFRFKW
ncbi:MAG: hypothetical protein JSV79_06835 [Armatimonadota bacterium]|nr:MAG: hypothetical protein JSV79_06835 [Armatimonadota bacterium]